MNSNISPTPAMCVVCGSRDTLSFADIQGVPVHTTVLWSTQEAARSAPVGDIEFTFCSSCGHIFNPRFEAARTEYTQAYENSLHFSPLFQRYAVNLADRLIERYGLRGKDILEIGAGKGDFLALMVERGSNRGIGFDPSYVPGSAHQDLLASGRMTIVQEFYTPASAVPTADLLVCRQVLEHIDTPRSLVEMIRQGVPPDRNMVVFFEVPNTLSSLRDLDVWTLIYEHCGYFTPQSLGRLFSSSGYDVLSVDELYEGIFLGVEARVRGGSAAEPSAHQDLRMLTELVESFRRRFQEKVAYWRHALQEMGRAGKRVAIWGGGARGVTFLNIVDTGRVVQYAVDINPRKAGSYVAGTGQQLVLPSALRSQRPDAVILMNPIYRQEVASMLDTLGLKPNLLVA
jgi:hypothetical protein